MNAKQLEKKAKISYQKRVESCKKKHRHPDELTARAAAMSSIQTHHNVEKLHVYHCPVCSGWHLTKKGSDIDVAITEQNPFHEKSAQEEFVELIKTGPIKTLSELAASRTHNDIWIHELCLELEEKNMIYRSKVNGEQVVWKYRKHQPKVENNINQQSFLMAA
jgi:hypothetical protein